MQISTNWSVSHLRHWRPPVTSTGHDLNRYTGGSWFKSKQSALRSILPNANIHHNENRPGRGQGQTPGVHVGACFSTWGVGGQQVPFWTPRSSTHQTGPRRFHTTWQSEIRLIVSLWGRWRVDEAKTLTVTHTKKFLVCMKDRWV